MGKVKLCVTDKIFLAAKFAAYCTLGMMTESKSVFNIRVYTVDSA